MQKFHLLNPSQRAAVEAVDGPVVVVAGPGTGKTHTLTRRLLHLLRDKEAAPSSILAVTFTRAAAGEMRERLAQLVPSGADLWIDTFHATALRFLREEAYPFGEGVPFTVVEDEEKRAHLEGLLPKKEISDFLSRLRREKERLEWPQDPVAREYQRRLFHAKRLDFDDLFLHAVRLFEERPAALEKFRARFRHVMVDEFQDTSLAQYRFLKIFAPDNLCAIGDPDQAIYGFGGDGFRAFERFAADHPGRRTLVLEENYRSTGTVVEAAKQIIAVNRPSVPRNLRARLEQGLPIEIRAHHTDKEEATIIVRRIESLLGGASSFTIDSEWAEKESDAGTYALSDIAVLYRFHAQAKAIERALKQAGLPFQTFGKKDTRNGEELSKEFGDEEWDAFRMDENAAPNLAAPRGEAISLMTLHRSKGLEFSAVFIAGCEDGVLPSRLFDDGETSEALEAERRLFYVGMTRAKRRLFLSSAKERFLFGETLNGGPSPFLRDISETLRALKEEKKLKPKAKDQQLSFFEF